MRTRRNFSAEEDAYILSRWPYDRLREIAAHLGRDKGSVSKRSLWLGLPPKPRNWIGRGGGGPGAPAFGERNRTLGEQRDAALRHHWDQKTIDDFAREWGVQPKTVRKRARRLGLPLPPPSKRPSSPRPPSRSRPASLRRRPWTPDDEERLRSRWTQGDRVAEIAAGLDRTVDAVKGRAATLGLGRRPGRAPISFFSAAEDDYIRVSWSSVSLAQMEADMGRPAASILARARRIGLPAKRSAMPIPAATVPIHARLSVSEAEDLDAYCRRHRLSRTPVLRAAVRAYLARTHESESP